MSVHNGQQQFHRIISGVWRGIQSEHWNSAHFPKREPNLFWGFCGGRRPCWGCSSSKQRQRARQRRRGKRWPEWRWVQSWPSFCSRNLRPFGFVWEAKTLTLEMKHSGNARMVKKLCRSLEVWRQTLTWLSLPPSALSLWRLHADTDISLLHLPTSTSCNLRSFPFMRIVFKSFNKTFSTNSLIYYVKYIFMKLNKNV